ncbi:succinate transmembrane transporter [Aureococcus anophagefferens]|nr:succinate transmembrane transporter [Aureococcus anophagefferens]
MVEDDAYVVEFTKLIEEAGEQTVGADQFIWSYGSRSLGFHGDDAARSLWTSRPARSRSRRSRACRRGRSGPTAVCCWWPSRRSCRPRSSRPSRGSCSRGPALAQDPHRLQRAALILAVAGVAVAASAIDRADNGEHLRGRHPKIGVGVMAAVGAMVLMGFAPGRTPKRVYFNYVHTGLGYAAVVLAAAATRSGISKAADLGHVADDRPWFTAQSAMLGVALAPGSSSPPRASRSAATRSRRPRSTARTARPARVDEEEEAGEAPLREFSTLRDTAPCLLRASSNVMQVEQNFALAEAT